MDWQQIADTIATLERTSSTSFKCSILQQLTQEERQVFYLALDPTKRYKLRSLPPPTGRVTGKRAIDLLYVLAAKPGATRADAQFLSDSITCDLEREIILRILRKDLDCGVGLTLARRYISALPDFNVQLAYREKDFPKFTKRYGTGPVLISAKLDGARTYVIGGEEPVYLSRTGLPKQNFRQFDDFFTAFPGHHFDCEMMAADGKFLSVMRFYSRAAQAEPGELHLHIFDLPSHPGDLTARLSALESLLAARPHPHVHIIPHYLEPQSEIPRYFKNALKSGLEGIMVKAPNAPYTRRRHISWVKFKPHDTVTVEVTGVVEGEGDCAGMVGALTFTHNGVAGKVGTGFSREERQSFWLNPPRLIDVQFHQTTEYGALREPRFIRVREDLEG